jgi:hypothetical protein
MKPRITLVIRTLRVLNRDEQERVVGGFVPGRNGRYCYGYVWRGRWYRSCPAGESRRWPPVELARLPEACLS